MERYCEEDPKPELIKLHEKVYREFDERPSGLILPDGKVAKRFDGKRVWRIVWKITRGLFFKEKGIFLPDNTPRVFDLYSSGERPKPFFNILSMSHHEVNIRACLITRYGLPN